MQCYGAGNFPDENLELLSVLQEACDRGIIVVNTTQCRRGTVSISYAGAKVSFNLCESGTCQLICQNNLLKFIVAILVRSP